MIQPTIVNRDVTLHIIKSFDLHISKKLGQNFLIKKEVVDAIIAAGEVNAGDAVLEIGPGIGTLTQGLAETGAAITAVELDRKLLEVLSKTLAAYDNVRVIHGDVLKLDISREMSNKPFKVIANLPYYITTPIIMMLLEMRLPIEVLVTMVQKEVAERMVAKPGGKEYGALSVAVQYYTEPDIIITVPPNSFIPAPAVESAVIRCRVRKEPPVSVDEKAFFRIVKAAFSQRRKTFSNTLKGAGFPKDMIAEILNISGIDGSRRGETMSIEEFAAVAKAWIQIR